MSDVKPATDEERAAWGQMVRDGSLVDGNEILALNARIDAEKARADAAEQKLWDASVRHGQDLKRIAALEEEKEREEGFTNDYIKHLHKAQERIAALEVEQRLLTAIRAVVENYRGEYESPVPDLTLRARYREQLFDLLNPT